MEFERENVCHARRQPRRRYYQSHKKSLMELFDSLSDETSKRALCFYVESFVKNCIYRSEQNPTRWKYFFGGKYERLYNFAAMLKNFSLLPPDKRALVESINQMIDEQTDFEKILAGNKCTLLNADIEGAELKLLHATEKIFAPTDPSWQRRTDFLCRARRAQLSFVTKKFQMI